MSSSRTQICTKCGIEKRIPEDFYKRPQSYGYRLQCKQCMIKVNTAINDKKGAQYHVEYYAANKEKFQQYRDKFKEKHPGYRNEYMKFWYKKQRQN